jgi:hypothetical protein
VHAVHCRRGRRRHGRHTQRGVRTVQRSTTTIATP